MPIYTYTTLDDPLAQFSTIPNGINDAGQIVGIYDSDGLPPDLPPSGVISPISPRASS